MAKKIDVFQIEDSVPIPVRTKKTPPLNTFEVGQSTAFLRIYRNQVQSYASQLKKRNGKEFTVKIEDEVNCRVWRIK